MNIGGSLLRGVKQKGGIETAPPFDPPIMPIRFLSIRGCVLNNFNALYNGGILFWKLEKLDKAISYFIRLQKNEPDDYDVLYNLGNLYYLSEEYEQAVELLEQYIEKIPDYPNAYLLLARLVEEKMDEKDTAQSLYQKGLEVAVNQHPFDDISVSLKTESTKAQIPSLKVIQ